MWKQIVELFAVKHRYLDELAPAKVNQWLSKMDEYIEANHQDIIQEINTKKAFDDALSASLKQAIETYIARR